MGATELTLVLPGSLETRSGGSIYDRHIVEGLRQRGWGVRVVELGGEFPVLHERARPALAAALADQPDGSTVVIDFLAMARSPDVVRFHAGRLEVLALVHLFPASELMPEGHQVAGPSALDREALLTCTGFISTSRFTATRLVSAGIERERIRVVIPGTDPAPMAAGPQPTSEPSILCVAALTPGKGQDTLVHALAGLSDIPWNATFAGSRSRDTAFAAGIERSIRRAGLSERITLAGECDERSVEALYHSGSIFVLPSRFESYGMALTEAMARGLPIVSTTAGAIPDTVPADAGILVEPGNVGALADALRTLVGDASEASSDSRSRRARMVAAGRRYAAGLPDWEETADRFGEALVALSGPQSAWK